MHGFRDEGQGGAGITLAMTVNASSALEESLQAIRASRSDRLYRKTLEKTAVRLKDLKALKPGLTVMRATDILWFYLGHRSWHLLIERKWPWADAEQWLAEQASQALLKS